MCCSAGHRDGLSLLIGLGLVIVDVHLPPSQVLGKGDPRSRVPGLSYMHSSTCEKLPRYRGSAPRTRHNLVLARAVSVSRRGGDQPLSLAPLVEADPPLPAHLRPHAQILPVTARVAG